MVDNISNRKPKPATEYSTLKLKGKDGKTINLENLAGLQKTKGNEALFKMYDKDNNGVIDENEAVAMRNNLQSIAGNGTISERELNKVFGKDSNAMEMLNKLADQQNAEKGKEYSETTGNTTTSFTYKSAFGDELGRDWKQVTTNKDGSTTTKYQDGSTEIRQKDGTYIFKDKNGNIVEQKLTNGTTMQTKDGQIIMSDEKGNQSVTDLKTMQTTSFPDENTAVTKDVMGKTVKTVVSKDGKTITTNYNEGKPGTVTVDGKSEDGAHNVSTKYASGEDMKNNLPQEMITDPQNPTLKKTTKFTYDSNGNVKAETTDSAGTVTTKYTNAKGEEIKEDSFNVKSFHVEKGQTISQIVDETIKKQGIDPSTISAEQKAEFTKQLLEANEGKYGTMDKGVNSGNKFFYADTDIQIPDYAYSTGELANVEVTGNKHSEETKKMSV